MEFIKANWDVPDHVHALTTTRSGGVSDAPFDSLNLSDNVGDRLDAVFENRRRLCQQLDIEIEPGWLVQVHGTSVIHTPNKSSQEKIEADGCYTNKPNHVCAVLTADCLPVTLYNHDNNSVAVVHAGWKGLAAGIIKEGKESLGEGVFSAWLGPAIGPKSFEVGEEVREAFVSKLEAHESAFQQIEPGKWMGDIYQLARQQLEAMGILRVFGGDYCTYSDSDKFYSFRREQVTGRMATLVWLD